MPTCRDGTTNVRVRLWRLLCAELEAELPPDAVVISNTFEVPGADWQSRLKHSEEGVHVYRQAGKRAGKLESDRASGRCTH